MSEKQTRRVASPPMVTTCPYCKKEWTAERSRTSRANHISSCQFAKQRAQIAEYRNR